MKQEVPTGGKAQVDAVRGTTKIAVLKGDPMSDNLLIGSCYDQKPFYMLSMAAEKIEWVTKTRMVYSHVAKKEVEHKFLRWSLSDTYNQEMNDCDIADQLRLIYRCLRFMRNTKWWWAEFLWFWETSMVNAYLLMKKYYLAKGLQPKWTHWEFQENIAWALLDPNGPPQYVQPSPTKAAKPKKTVGPRRPRLTEDSLKLGGDHGHRLDQSSSHFHSPVEDDKKKTTVCQLHRLANKVINDEHSIPSGSRKDVMICGNREVALCVNCWKPFHSLERFENEDFCRILSNHN